MDRPVIPDIVVDVMGETCPIPLVQMRKAVMKAEKGRILEIRGTHGPSKKEIPMAVQSLGLELLRTHEDPDGVWHIFIRK
jgi:tRNA 2-thiouridine synthesizing protein A